MKTITTNQGNNMSTKLENLSKQLHLSNCIDILMKQTLKLMDMVNANQVEVNHLKAEQDQLKMLIKKDGSAI